MGVPKRMISAMATRFVSIVTRSASRVTSLVSPSRRSPGESSAKIATIGRSRNASGRDGRDREQRGEGRGSHGSPKRAARSWRLPSGPRTEMTKSWAASVSSGFAAIASS